MSDGNWKDVLADYKYAQEESWGKDLIWMEELVSHLLAKRDLSELYPVTSHYVLLLSIAKSLGESWGKPHLRIFLNSEIDDREGQFRYKFSVVQYKNQDAIYRLSEESIFCSFEKSLEVFDEMFEKLKLVTK